MATAIKPLTGGRFIDANKLKVTISLGLGGLTNRIKRLEDLINEADEALLQAKRLNGNRAYCNLLTASIY